MAETKEALAGQGEGMTKKPGQGSVNDKVTRHARAKVARRGTVAADRRIVIEDMPAAATIATGKTIAAATLPRGLRVLGEDLQSIPVVVRRTSQGRRARVWRSANGEYWRQGGIVHLRKWAPAGGERRFVVTLYKGANVDDVEFLLWMVEVARRSEGFGTLWEHIEAEWADELTFSTGSSSRPYGDPYSMIDRSPDAVVCDEPLCSATWHPDWQNHVVDHVRHREAGKSWEIEVRRPVEGRDPWTVDIVVDDFFGTPADVAELVNELNWMRAECERANACRATGAAA